MATDDLPDPNVGAPPARRAERPGRGRARGTRSTVARARAATGRAARRIRAATLWTARWVVVHAVVAALSVGAGLVVVALATEYGYHPVRNAATWASQPFAYAVDGACAQCHEPQQASTAQAGHEALRCEACHGPQQAHVHAAEAAERRSPAPGSPWAGQPGPGAAAAGPELAVSIGPERGSSASCLACHEAVLGRPRTMPMITAPSHFGPAACALCHDPHATTALVPPPVRHDLAGLPGCLVCHGAGRIREMPARHPVLTGLDCLACHLRRTD